MAAAPSIPSTYKTLYSDQANNPFGPDEEDQELCYGAIYSVFRSTQAPLSVAVLHKKILADFTRCVGGLEMFFWDGNSATGVLQLIHGLQSYPGAPGRSRDRMRTFGYEGGVGGVDIATIAFDEAQLAITVNVIVPVTIERVQQLLSEEPSAATLGPFFAGDANMRTMKTRSVAYFPSELVEILLGSNLTTR
jgi:hypothetical protein